MTRVSTSELLETLHEIFMGQGIRGDKFWRFPCPVCMGGLDDFIWRPLVVSDDGRIWCDASEGYVPGTDPCDMNHTCWLRTPEQLAAALEFIKD